MFENLGEEEGLEEFKTSNKIALIDADTIVYAACSTQEYADEVLSKEFYSDEEYEELINHPFYDDKTQAIWQVDEEAVLNLCIERITEIQALTNTKSVELHFTEGRNFRYDVDPMYKGNRSKTKYPAGLRETKAALLKLYSGGIHSEFEADDIVVMLKRTQPTKYILCAVDKDVYKAVPGKHFNYYRSVLYNIDMKWVETEAKDAYQFPYIQTLMGDSTDNIKGCPGIGKVKAAKAIEGLVTPCDMWKAVVKLFKSKKLTVKDAIRDMRLVNMHQLTIDKKIVLWEPPCEA